MLMLAVCESMNKITLKLLYHMSLSTFPQGRSSTRPEKALPGNRISLVERLPISRMNQILLRTSNQCIGDFTQTLISMGVLIEACSGYGCVKLRTHLPFIVYAGCSLTFPFVLIVNLVLIALASVPHENGVVFQLFWERRIVNKESRLQLL